EEGFGKVRVGADAVYRPGRMHRLRGLRSGMSGLGDLRARRSAGEVGRFRAKERGLFRPHEHREIAIMRELRAWTEEEIRELQERIRTAPPGSKIDEAKKYGIDLTLVIQQLRLAPAERVRQMLELAESAERVRGLARKR